MFRDFRRACVREHRTTLICFSRSENPASERCQLKSAQNFWQPSILCRALRCAGINFAEVTLIVHTCDIFGDLEGRPGNAVGDGVNVPEKYGSCNSAVSEAVIIIATSTTIVEQTNVLWYSSFKSLHLHNCGDRGTWIPRSFWGLAQFIHPKSFHMWCFLISQPLPREGQFEIEQDITV